MPLNIFTLPPELREQIYAYLLPISPTLIFHPLPGVGLTSTSHPLPPANLLNVCPQLTDELLAYYYAVAS